MEKTINAVEPATRLNTEAAGEDLNLLDLLILLAKGRKQIAYITVGATLVAIVVSLFQPNTYTASTLLLPPQQSQSTATMMLSQLNPLVASLGKDLAAQNSSDLYVALLRSRSVADNLIQQFDLRKVYRRKTSVDARDELWSRSSFKVTKEGIIEIAVDDRDAKRAADIANAYVSELQKLTQALAATEASQRRLFYERQLMTAQDSLSEAETALKKTQEKTGLIQLDAQAKAIIESVATLRAQIAAQEIQLQRVQLFATPENPDLQRAQQELVGLRRQLAIVERRAGGGNGDTQIATAKVPAAGLEYIRGLRNVKYYETIYELLAKQFEAAKLDEAKNATTVQVIDKALPPEKKSKPKRLLVAVLSAFLSFLFASFWVLLAGYHERLLEDPEYAAGLHRIRTYLLGKDKVHP